MKSTTTKGQLRETERRLPNSGYESSFYHGVGIVTSFGAVSVVWFMDKSQNRDFSIPRKPLDVTCVELARHHLASQLD